MGIDPGIKTAFAALDLNGKPVASGTLKEADADRIVEEIAKLGVPSIIASDVNPAPSFVLKIAARFNVRTFVPIAHLHERDKKEIAPAAENPHERDAFAAAVKCYRIYANRLRQIDAMETTLNKNMLKHLVIQGFTLRNAMLLLEHKEVNKEQPKRKGTNVEKNKDAKLVVLVEENINLKKALDLERKNVAMLEAEIAKLKRTNYIQIGKDNEVRRLRAQVKKMGWLIKRLKKKIS